MASHQRFQRFTLRRQNNHRIGGQPGHRNFPSQLPPRHATAPSIRLLFCCRKAASLRLPSHLQAGRTRNFRSPVLVYALFTGAAAFSTNVWMLAIFRFLAGIGVGGEWAMAGTYVAEAWPEDRRKMGAGYLQTGYYFGFFVAAALNYTIGASLGWRAMFLCGLFPVVVSIATLLRVKEPERWEHKHQEIRAALEKKHNPFAVIFSSPYLGRTITMSALLTVSIIGLWAGAVYEPTAIVFLSRQAGMEFPEAAKMASYGTGLLSIGTILGCIAAPWLAERIGRRSTLALYYFG